MLLATVCAFGIRLLLKVSYIRLKLCFFMLPHCFILLKLLCNANVCLHCHRGRSVSCSLELSCVSKSLLTLARGVNAYILVRISQNEMKEIVIMLQHTHLMHVSVLYSYGIVTKLRTRFRQRDGMVLVHRCSLLPRLIARCVLNDEYCISFS